MNSIQTRRGQTRMRGKKANKWARKWVTVVMKSLTSTWLTGIDTITSESSIDDKCLFYSTLIARLFLSLSLMYPIYISSWKIQLQEKTTKRSTWTIEMALTTEKNLIARLSNFSPMSSFSSQLASCRLECPRNIIGHVSDGLIYKID